MKAIALFLSMLGALAAEWPGETWKRATPAEAAMDEGRLKEARDYALSGEGSGYITRGGKLVMSWGDVAALYDLKSTTKSFGSAALGLAVKDGKLRLEDKAGKHHPTLGLPPAGDDKSKPIGDANAASGWLDRIAILNLASQTAGFEKPGGYTRLLFEPGTKWDYSDSGPNWLAECITLAYAKDVDELMFERVFEPIGIKRPDLRWRKNSYRPAEINGIRRREFGAGIHANVDAMARFGLLWLRNGKWREEEILPASYIEIARSPIRGQEELPVVNAKEYGNASAHYGLLWWNNADGTLEGMPTDAYWSWGLHDSLIVVIPSLDTVVARAGKSWKRAEGGAHYDVLKPFLHPIVASTGAAVQARPQAAAPSPGTSIAIQNGKWFINGQITCPGALAEGLLMNVRMVNSTFEDTAKPDFDPNANTAAFLRHLDDYIAHGARAFTLCLQGGMPGYESAINSAFAPDGSLRESYLARVARVIEACDRAGAAVILGCYYQRQDQILRDEKAVRAGVVNVAKWIRERGYKNVVLEIANEFDHGGFDHKILKTAAGEAELIRLARATNPNLLVSASGLGHGRLATEVAEASDFLLIHFNGTKLEDIPARIQALKKHNKPIVCNEDDKTGEAAARAAELSVQSGASWGLMLNKLNQYVPFTFKGAADDPIVYARLKELTSSKKSSPARN